MTTNKGPPGGLGLEALEVRLCLAAGGLDSSFGMGGKVTTDFQAPGNSEAHAAVALPDGSAILAGRVLTGPYHSQFVMARYRADGSLDLSFGRAGQVVQSFGGISNGSDVVRQADGKLLVAGNVDGRLLVARFNADGSLDSSFGNRGRFVTDAGRDYTDASLRITPDGKIVVGAESAVSLVYGETDLEVLRLNANGTLDRSFGVNGSFLADFGPIDQMAGIELMPDGRIVAGGAWIDNAGNRTGIALMRLTGGGQYDRTFAGGGKVSGRLFAGRDAVKDIALDGEGRVLLLNERFDGVDVARFRADGVLDRSFGQRGVRAVTLETPGASGHSEAGRLTLLADGRIVAVAAAHLSGDNVPPVTPVMLAVRLLPAGGLDRTFDGDGIAEVEAGEKAAAVAVVPDGSSRLIVAGAADGNFAGARVKSDGAVERVFGSTPSAAGVDTAYVVLPLPDGSVIVAGGSAGKDGSVAALAKYQPGGQLQMDFGVGGRVRLRVLEGDHVINGLGLLPSGDLIATVAKDFDTGSLMRFKPDGALDTSFGTAGAVPLGALVSGLKVLKSGQMLVVVGGAQPALRRYNGDGTPDTSFATSGALALTDFNVQRSQEIIELADGKILLAGQITSGDRYLFGVRRLNTDGTPDTGFGVGGLASIDVGGYRFDSPNAIEVQNDGKILVAGAQEQFAGSNYALARFTVGGAMDNDFGNHGVVITRLPPSHALDQGISTDVAMAVRVQADGKIIVVGVDDVNATDGSTAQTTKDWGIVRYNADGSLDNSFGQGGRLDTSFGRDDSPVDALITADGKLLVIGTGEPNATGSDFALARYLLTDPHPITAKVEAGVLKITGTDVAETIRLAVSSQKLSITGVNQSFATSLFSRIEIDAKGDNDTVDASRVNVPVRVDGGAGNDSILGGGGADVLLGNAGNDTIFGGGGADTLRGDDGNDYLNGGAGADRVFGDAGNDQIFALDGVADQVDGGAGFDRVKSDGTDVLAGIDSVLL
jgi:uncharacterized delta-60 repeat protein